MTNDTTIPLINPATRKEMTGPIGVHAQTAMRPAIQADLETFRVGHPQWSGWRARLSPRRESWVSHCHSACLLAPARGPSLCAKPILRSGRNLLLRVLGIPRIHGN